MVQGVARRRVVPLPPRVCCHWEVCCCLQFAQLEAYVGEIDRSRAIYELAINQPVLDMPELLWKSYIDFEIGQGEHENARTLYERLLDRTKHVKVSAPSPEHTHMHTVARTHTLHVVVCGGRL